MTLIRFDYTGNLFAWQKKEFDKLSDSSDNVVIFSNAITGSECHSNIYSYWLVLSRILGYDFNKTCKGIDSYQ